MENLAAEAMVRGASRKPTPEQAQGPFYPLTRPEDAGPDLAHGKAGKAQGEHLTVNGRVFDTKGAPLPGVLIEIWQANSFGRYNHPNDDNPAPLDPDFAGYGKTLTDPAGRYQFRTVKPAPYSVGAGRFRTRHIHFILTSATSRLITQMYFAGEPLNETDMLLSNTADRETLIVDAQPSGEGADSVLTAEWDITMWQG